MSNEPLTCIVSPGMVEVRNGDCVFTFVGHCPLLTERFLASGILQIIGSVDKMMKKCDMVSLSFSGLNI
jgi:hypothetical protein